MTYITQNAARRLTLASQVLNEPDPRALTLKLAGHLGLPITESKLATVTVADLKGIMTGEESLEPEQEPTLFKRAARHLWGSAADDAADPQLPALEPYLEGEMPGSLRVAVASSQGTELDGHFGSAPRFLIYQVGRDRIKLIDMRSTAEADQAEDKNMARCQLIRDCQILYVQSIGGPAAAKVVRAGVHPVKMPAGGAVLDSLARLQAVLEAPPPWLARMMGVDAQSLRAFSVTEEEA